MDGQDDNEGANNDGDDNRIVYTDSTVMRIKTQFRMITIQTRLLCEVFVYQGRPHLLFLSEAEGSSQGRRRSQGQAGRNH